MFLEIILSKTVTFNLSQFGITKKKNVWATAQKRKFCIKDFFSKCHHIRSFLRICRIF